MAHRQLTTDGPDNENIQRNEYSEMFRVTQQLMIQFIAYIATGRRLWRPFTSMHI